MPVKRTMKRTKGTMKIDDHIASKDQKAISLKKDRVFQSEWQSKYSQLPHDADKKIMTCKICLEENKSTAFTILSKGHHCKRSNLNVP